MTRPKQTHKGRSSDSVMEARVDEVIAIFSAQANISKYALRERLTKQWKCHWKTVDRIQGRARDELLKRLKRDKEEFRCDALTSLERETQHPDAKVRLAAWAQIREMCGLDEARRTEITGADGGAIIVAQAQFDPAAVRGPAPAKKPDAP